MCDNFKTYQAQKKLGNVILTNRVNDICYHPAVPEAANGLIVLGAQLFKGLEQKGIKSLTDCLKKCATAGAGIPV